MSQILASLLYIGATQKHPLAPLAEITTQPEPVTATEGDTAMLTVTAINATGYQWFKVGNTTPLATTQTLDLGQLSLDEAGSYYVLVFNKDNRSVKSDVVQVVVTEKPTTPRFVRPNSVEELHLGGDSNSANYFCTSWGTLLAQEYGFNLVNHAVVGYTANQEAIILMANMPMVAVNTTMIMLGTNNFKNSTSLELTYKDIFAANRTIASAQFAKDTIFFDKMTLRDKQGNAVTRSIAVGDDGNNYFGMFGSRVPKGRAAQPNANWYYVGSGSDGDNLTFNFNGTGLGIRSFIGASSGDEPRPVKITIDGTDVTTWTIPYGMGKGGPDCKFLIKLAPGNHTGKITFIGNGKHVIDSIDVLKNPADTYAFPFQSNDIPRFADNGYTGNEFGTNTFELNDSVIDAFNEACDTMLKTELEGFAINKFHTNNYYNPKDPTQVQADGIHEAQPGQNNMVVGVKETWIL